MTYRNSYLSHSQLANELLQTPSTAVAGNTTAKKRGLATRRAISERQTNFTDEEIQTLRNSNPVLSNIMRIQQAFQEGKPIQVADANVPMPKGDYTDTKSGSDFQRALMEGTDEGIEIMKGLMKKGYTPEVAAGFVGKGILSAATGIPFAGQALSALTGQFENRPLSAGIIDEFGNVYDEEELNRQNALGGYYSEAARSGRRRTARIENMLNRLALGKKISYKKNINS